MKLLLEEFGQVCNSADLHEILSKRKIKDNESLDEYFLTMKQLCSKNNIEDSALIQYVIKMAFLIRYINKYDSINIIDLINKELQANFVNNRDELRQEAKKQILKVQDQNRKTYNLRRKKANKFKINDVVAIKRTQQGPGLKLKPKFLGPNKVKINDTYDVQKIGFTEGPMYTSTCAEYMKPWPDDT